MSEIKKMYCPSCGAPVSFEVGREDTFCSHCGSQLYFKDDHLEVKLKHEERKMEHEEKILEYIDRDEERKMERRDDKIVIISLIAVFVFAILLWIAVIAWASMG